RSERDAASLHASFAAVAASALTSSPRERIGERIWALLIAWYAAVAATALLRKHERWLDVLAFLFPLCACFVFPDGFLVLGLKTIAFPDAGVGRIFGVPSFMPWMWAIPLFLVILTGAGLEDRGYTTNEAALGSGIVGLIIMGGSEFVLTRIPLWHVLEKCSTIGQHAAIYVLLPEFCLGISSYLGWSYIRSHKQVSYLVRSFVAFAIMTMYLGNLIVCFMVVDGDKLEWEAYLNGSRNECT
ncbi:hypothetical protein ACHAWF_002290, partial [Thalassiosira exigua]